MPIIYDNKEKTYFHSWRAVCTKIHIASSAENKPPKLRFFDRDIHDKSRTNMEVPCSFARDSSFIINEIKLSAVFPSTKTKTEFLRSAMLELFIGDIPYLRFPAKLCMNQTEDKIGVFGEMFLNKPFIIPPRQPIYANLTMSDRLAGDLLKIQNGEAEGFAEIKVELKGIEQIPQKIKTDARNEAEKSWENWDEKEIEREVKPWTPSSYLDPNKES